VVARLSLVVGADRHHQAGSCPLFAHNRSDSRDNYRYLERCIWAAHRPLSACGQVTGLGSNPSATWSSSCANRARTASQFCGQPKRQRSIRRGVLCAASRRRVRPRIRPQGPRGRLAGSGKASSHISGTAAVYLASDPLDSGATGRREPAPPVALVGASLGHQAPATRLQAWRRSTGFCSSAQVLFISSASHDDFPCIRFYRRDVPKLLNCSRCR
jgi:hypothetical protein